MGTAHEHVKPTQTLQIAIDKNKYRDTAIDANPALQSALQDGVAISVSIPMDDVKSSPLELAGEASGLMV